METKIINNRYELIACTAVATEAHQRVLLLIVRSRESASVFQHRR